MSLIGICGKSNAGKDTAADVLVKDFGYVKVALADPMKRACAEWFGWDEQTLWGPSEMRNTPDKRYPNSFSSADEGRSPQGWLTPRHALQTLGTEWGRDCYDDIWVDIAIRTAKTLLEDHPGAQPYYDHRTGVEYGYNSRVRGVVISDVRFPNEVAAIKAAGGRIWKIIRPLVDPKGNIINQTLGWQRHSSESYADGIEADLDIANVGSLETFQQMIRDLAAR